jgi:transposase-like protein
MSGPRIRIVVTRPQSKYSESFKRMVVAEYESGRATKKEISRKYGIAGHSRLLDWCRKYGGLPYDDDGQRGRPMKDPQKRRIKELERALADERLKVAAYEKLVDIIEREDGDRLSKKDVARQLANLRRVFRDV